jgi:NitT/TauT family transport system substrate-binding protein
MSLTVARLLRVSLLLTLMLGGLTFAAPNARSQEPSLRIGVMPITESLQVFVADAKGFFKQEGLKVTLTTLPGGAAIASAIEGGSLDVGLSAFVPLSQAHVKGFEFVAVAAGSMWDESAYRGKKSHTVIMVPKNSSVKTAKDFEGKKVSVVALRSLADLAFTAWAEKHGADSSKVQKMEIGFPQQEAALQRGQVDGVLQAEPFTTSTLENNAGVVLAEYPYSAIAPRFLIGTWIAKKGWVESHPKEMAAFGSALRQATRYINSDPVDARKILTLYTKLSQELANKISLSVFPDSWRKEDVQVVIDQMAKHKFLPKTFDSDSIVSRHMK